MGSNPHKCADAHLFRQPFHPESIVTEDDRVIQPKGTVVLPIMPGRDHWDFGVSVMTLCNVLYTPEAKVSELSWSLLESEGFVLHDLQRHHEIVRSLPSHVWALLRGSKVIRHPGLPGVDILWCLRKPKDGKLYVGVIADTMVNMKEWKVGIEDGILGKAVDIPGAVAWTQASEHSAFEEIVLGDSRREHGVGRVPGDTDVVFAVA
jgi:hypothetical protein